MHSLTLSGLVRDRLRLHTALARDALHRDQVLQPVHRGPHHVVRVVRAQALGQDVVDAAAFQHRAHRAAGDHAGSRSGRFQEHPAGAVRAHDLVGNGLAGAGHGQHLAPRGVDRLADRFTDLVGLAGRDAHVAVAVAHRHQRVEAEAPAALHHLGHAVDRDDVLDLVAVAVAAIAAIPAAARTTPARTTAPRTTASAAALTAAAMATTSAVAAAA